MSLKLLLIVIHRWLGVVLCLFMAAWFFSGAVLMYVPFPSLSKTERFNQMDEVDASKLRLSPIEAIRIADIDQSIDKVRLVSRDGRPLYVISTSESHSIAVWADDGSNAKISNDQELHSIAERFSSFNVKSIHGPIDYDQWIVHQGFDGKRPYFRVRMDDQLGTDLYIAQSTGEVLQSTTRFQRGWNYVGAVVHWIYPTVLRRHWAAWDQVVWWLSLLAIGSVVLGIVLGFDHMIKAVRRRAGKISFYRGWMKWHHVLGIFASVFVLTWIFSGWLSMDHGRLFSMPDPTSEQVTQFRGLPTEQAAQVTSIFAIQQLGSFAELEIKSVGGTVLLFLASKTRRDIYSVESEHFFEGGLLPSTLISSGVRAAWPKLNIQSVENLSEQDVYRKVRQSELPRSTIRIKLDDATETWVHVDSATGKIVSVMDRSRRVYRWVYHGLHSLDFPALIKHRPLWDFVMLTLLLVGFIFSMTGAYLGFRRLKRTLGSNTN
jgi:hypothetical protein